MFFSHCLGKWCDFREKYGNLGINRTAESQSDCKDDHCFLNGCNKCENRPFIFSLPFHSMLNAQKGQGRGGGNLANYEVVWEESRVNEKRLEFSSTTIQLFFF